MATTGESEAIKTDCLESSMAMRKNLGGGGGDEKREKKLGINKRRQQGREGGNTCGCCLVNAKDKTLLGETYMRKIDMRILAMTNDNGNS